MQNVRGHTSGADDAAERERRPRGRPRAFDREAALETAMRLFWRKGYAATSIAELTDAMGIGAPSLYAAFGCKEALYGEAIRLYAETRAPQVWSRFAAAATAREAIEGLLRDAARSVARGAGDPDPPGCMVTLSASGQEGCDALGTLVSDARAQVRQMIEDRLARGVREGDLPAGTDAARLARLVLSVQQGMSIQARDGASAAELEGAALAFMAGWDAIVAGAPPGGQGP